MRFTGVTIIIPTLRETETFVKLVELILKTVDTKDISEFLVVVSEKTSRKSLPFIQKGKEISEKSAVPFRVIKQTKPFFGGAILDSFMKAKGSHLVLETPDLNSAPEKLADLIKISKNNPSSIVSCSRWLPGGGFINYSGFKKIWNKMSQKFLAFLYRSDVTDFTFGVHIVPTALYQALNFKELKHPINLEQMVIPIRLGINIIECPAICKTLENDITVNPLLNNIAYLRPALRWRFAKRDQMINKDTNWKTLMKMLREEN